MKMVGHQDRRKNTPFPKFYSGVLECLESCLVCQHRFAVFNAGSLAGGVPALQRFSHAKGIVNCRASASLAFHSRA
jgi:hypothetical protein